MCSRDWRLRIQDILNAIDSIQQRTAKMTLEEFESNETIAKAVLFDFIVIGEASRHIPAAIQSRYAQIPWRLMNDMRNVLAHEYFRVNLILAWRTIQNNLPPLKIPLQQLFAAESIEP
ncbi:MAG: DUF86 domain-containing protein [Verrucomicrobia bacterium]|nr:DUF86 domain-containing protein [Leptolyngbya sp. ES-bin-22]